MYLILYENVPYIEVWSICQLFVLDIKYNALLLALVEEWLNKYKLNGGGGHI